MPPRTRLKVGFSGLAKVVTVIISLAIAGVAAFVALVAYGFAYGARESISSTIPDGIYHRDESGKLVPGPGVQSEIDTVGWIGVIAGGLCSLVFLFLALYLAMRVLRTGAWLTGSVLNVRKAGGKRSVNLSTARVVAGGNPLVLTADKVSLRVGGLPEEQILMVANAISNQRSRIGSAADDPAFAVADRLRGLAKDPLT